MLPLSAGRETSMGLLSTTPCERQTEAINTGKDRYRSY